MIDFTEMLRGIDKNTLQEGVQRAEAFAKTAEGKAMMAKLGKSAPSDKDALMDMLKKNPDIMKTIENFLKS